MNPSDSFCRILCVTDEPALQREMASEFSGYGFDVVTASHGIDAMMQFNGRSGAFFAILTDNDSRGQNSLEFVRHVRESGYRGRVVVISGRLTSNACREYLHLAVSGFFRKPFDLSMVATMLTQTG
jgi:DNA-binding NtrC family response regulator